MPNTHRRHDATRALRRRHSFGGGAPGDFDRRRRRADRYSSAAAASVNCRRRQRSAAWESKIKHVGLVLPSSSHHARHEYNENRQTGGMQHLSPFI